MESPRRSLLSLCRSLLAGDRGGARAPRGLEPARSAGSPLKPRLFLALLAFSPLHAAPVPHPARPDRLVETRDGLTVEYSPGQETWMEMAFGQMQATAREPGVAAAPAARRTGPALPGSARHLRENRAILLAAIARQIGLAQPTDLQGRAFDTFLGYYDLITELKHELARDLPATLAARHLAIWQRDDLVGRLRAGAHIEGMSYDQATDSGRFDFNQEFDKPEMQARYAPIYAAIKQQQLKHRLNIDRTGLSAAFTLGGPPAQPAAPKTPAAPGPAAQGPDLVIPIIYRGDLTTPAREAEFSLVGKYLQAAAAALAEQAAGFRHPELVSLILHETAEIGLLGNIITSPDRRWLCDGTANYVAWRVARDLCGAEFARQVYDLEAQLRLHVAQQPKIDLAGWVAAENAQEDQAGTDLNHAHYAFATRAMFLLAERHGENALAQLWSDVARTPVKKVTAKTFADAYRKRFKADLAKLVREAEQKPIPPAPPATPQT